MVDKKVSHKNEHLKASHDVRLWRKKIITYVLVLAERYSQIKDIILDSSSKRNDRRKIL